MGFYLRSLALVATLALGTAAIAVAQTSDPQPTAGEAPVSSSLTGTDPSTTLDTLPPPLPVSSTLAASTVPPTAAPPSTNRALSASDPTLGPVCGVAGGTGCRIIAFYGNPLSNRMGVLGANPPQQMIPHLVAQTAKWRAADPATPTRCAMELIAIAAQADPGKNKKHRLRMSAPVIDRVLGWARGAGCLLILDVQVGWSSVPEELPYLQPWLNQPDVHLALDPEWDMPEGVQPGARVGTMSSAHIQYAIDLLTKTVADRKVPPKLLVVHRFRDFMVTTPEAIRTNQSVRLLVNMDGFGPPSTKLTSYRVAKAGMPTTLTGFKLFFINDKPLMQPADVLPLTPVPMFINYQ